MQKNRQFFYCFIIKKKVSMRKASFFTCFFSFIEKKENITSNKHNDLDWIKRQKNLNSSLRSDFFFTKRLLYRF